MYKNLGIGNIVDDWLYFRGRQCKSHITRVRYWSRILSPNWTFTMTDGYGLLLETDVLTAAHALLVVE